MTRTRLAAPSLPVFIVAAVVVAITAFGLTRWFIEPSTATLPPLEVTADAAAAAPGALDPTKLNAARRDTVVSIESTIGGEPMNGAGVVVDAAAGTIVTASHVVKDYDHGGVAATTIVVRFAKGDEVVAKLQALDQFNDLAILHVDPAAVPGLVAAPLADNSDAVVVGAPVAAIGAPYGYAGTQTLGNVSATHRVVGSRINIASEIPDMIQFDASINQGNSGGPLFNARGEVIGIVQQIATPAKVSSGVSFAVSSNIVRHALDQYRRTGRIDYAYTGLETRKLTPQLASAANLDVTKGAIVQSATGPAAAAGLATGRRIAYLGSTVAIGDVVVELAGRPVTSRDDLLRIAGQLDPEAPVDITYVRAGEQHTAKLDPAPRPIV